MSQIPPEMTDDDPEWLNIESSQQIGSWVSRAAVIIAAAQGALFLTFGALSNQGLTWLIASLGVLSALGLSAYTYRGIRIEQAYWLALRLRWLQRKTEELQKERDEAEARKDTLEKERLEIDERFLKRQIELAGTGTDRSTLAGSDSSFTAPESARRAARLVSNIALIEDYGSEFISTSAVDEGNTTPTERLSVFGLRSELQRLGVWSDEDTAEFDMALRFRNAIVHRDSRRKLGNLEDAVAASDRLVSKLRRLVR